MTQNIEKYLAFAGTLPFIAVAADQSFGLSSSTAMAEALRVYALIILSFMAGACWGLTLGKNLSLLIYSNMIALLGWIAFIQMDQSFYLAMILLFLLLLPADYFCLKRGVIHKSYMILRLIITGIVVVCLAIIAVYTA